MEVGTKLEENGHQATVQEIKNYQTLIGSLIYLATQTKPDIVFAVQKLIRFNLNFTKIADDAAKKVL